MDEVFVRSAWQPNMAVTRKGCPYGKKVFITGNAAHQNIPTGGYWMNMGIGDAFDFGWKLSAVFHGEDGPALLELYE
ncbi:hypothetical protein SEUCBS140593_010808 [Sporothrix eucalyptigena]|uniref:FAD-binding domain-containing protein n=1 Tax=Sporothrix eucalyptigena TaxID=1812306 RepID=A0ABP0D2T0_9PEZI